MAGGKKEKVIFVTDFYYPHWTGLSKSLHNLIQSIKEEFSITVLTIQHEKRLKRYEKTDSIQIIREPYFFTISRSKYSIKMIFKFMVIIYNYDVVFINSPCANILFIALFTKILRKKLLIFHQGDLTLPKGILNRVIEGLFNIFSYVSFSLADKVATYSKDYAVNSHALKPFLNKCYPLLLPVVVDTDLKNPARGKKNKQILFGFAGRFVEEKGFDILFDAIPLIKETLPSSHFVFAGETEIGYERFFQKNINKFNQVKKYVTLLGLLSGKQLAEFYHSVDFIIIPSRSDCFNLVQAEAMLCKTPCIVSNIPGLRFLVKTTGFGVLFEKDNSEDLAEKAIIAARKRAELMVFYKKAYEVLNAENNMRLIHDFLTT